MTMRRVVLIVCLLLAVVCVLFVALSPGHRREKSFPDGSIVRIEKVGFTTNEEEIDIGDQMEKFKKTVFEFWQSKVLKKPPVGPAGMSSWYMNANIRSNEPALYVYVSRRVPGKGYRGVNVQGGQLIDEHGCVYTATQSGGSDDGRLSGTTSSGMGGTQYSVGWFRFEAFPRREKSFRFRIYENAQLTGLHPPENIPFIELTIANPTEPKKISEWPAEPLPLTSSQDKVSFILTNVAVKSGRVDFTGLSEAFIGSPSGLETGFQVTEDGESSTNWSALYCEMYDASGNYVSSSPSPYFPLATLCFREPAWKLRVKFFGSEKSRGASNAVWTIANLRVPDAGEYTPVNQSNVLQGVPIRFGCFGGPGEFNYSNGIVLFSKPPDKYKKYDRANPIAWPKNWTGSKGALKPTFRLEAREPNLAIDIGDLSADQRLTVRAVDNQGREFYGHKLNDWSYSPKSGHSVHPVPYMEPWYEQEGSFVIVDLPSDARTVDITFCIHTCRTGEFVFKPPVSSQ
jgi:hypothetical protein